MAVVADRFGAYCERGADVAPAPAFAFPRPRAEVRRSSLLGWIAQARDRTGATGEDEIAALRAALRRQGATRRLVARALGAIGRLAYATIGLNPHDVQYLAAWEMLRGRMVEMQTGEGKTLVAALVAGAHGLAGRAVHVVTANDYLAARDADAMGPLLGALGLRVRCVQAGDGDDERRESYGADIVYVTAKSLMFDYLRDRLRLGEHGQSPLRRELAVLRAQAGGQHGFFLRGLQVAVVDEADGIFIDDAAVPLIISAPKPESEQAEIAARAIGLAKGLAEGRDFVLAPSRGVALTDAGRSLIDAAGRTAGPAFAGRHWREHYVTQALMALHVFRKDRDYIVRDDAIAIVDAGTGRAMPDRSWERGLHQMVQSKEGLAVTAPGESTARITHQAFFARYVHLCGMSGTLWEARREIASVYGLKTVRIPTHRRRRLRGKGVRVFSGGEGQRAAVVERALRLQAEGRPVLIGARSVLASERISAALAEAGVAHQLLNARTEAEEAAIIAEAGRSGRVTVATALAGRGTDIRLDPVATAAGGLHVIATERHEARRIDRQLFGRAARQGDPGSHEEILCLDDELLRRRLAGWQIRLARLLPFTGMRRLVAMLAQRRASRAQKRAREALMRAEEAAATLLGFAGPRSGPG